MGFGDEENCPGRHRLPINPDRVGIEGESPGRCFSEHVKKGGPEPAIFPPIGIRGQMFPVCGPVADQLPILGRGRSRQMGDSGIDPANSVGDIGSVHGNFILNKETFRDVRFDPLTQLAFVFHGPLAAGDIPDLTGRLRQGGR